MSRAESFATAKQKTTPIRLSDAAVEVARIASGFTGESVAAYCSRVLVERGNEDIERLYEARRAGAPAPAPAAAPAEACGRTGPPVGEASAGTEAAPAPEAPAAARGRLASEETARRDAEIRRLRAQGLTLARVAKAAGCSVPTVQNVLKAAERARARTLAAAEAEE